MDIKIVRRNLDRAKTTKVYRTYSGVLFVFHDKVGPDQPATIFWPKDYGGGFIESCPRSFFSVSDLVPVTITAIEAEDC